MMKTKDEDMEREKNDDDVGPRVVGELKEKRSYHHHPPHVFIAQPDTKVTINARALRLVSDAC